MTCMSVFEEGSKIAFACYNEERNEIILENDISLLEEQIRDYRMQG